MRRTRADPAIAIGPNDEVLLGPNAGVLRESPALGVKRLVGEPKTGKVYRLRGVVVELDVVVKLASRVACLADLEGFRWVLNHVRLRRHDLIDHQAPERLRRLEAHNVVKWNIARDVLQARRRLLDAIRARKAQIVAGTDAVAAQDHWIAAREPRRILHEKAEVHAGPRRLAGNRALPQGPPLQGARRIFILGSQDPGSRVISQADVGLSH